MRILLVEDNLKLSENIAAVLRLEQYEVETAPTVATALDFIHAQPFDLVILDLNLPDGDGISLCADLRQAGITSPILMLTARLNLESKVEGLDSGADDYLTKPFLMDELLARVRALSRRGRAVLAPLIKIGNIEIDVNKKSVLKNGVAIEISPLEMKIIECLLTHRGQVQSAVQLYEAVWGDEGGELLFSDTLKVHISRLRKKIGDDVIETVPGYGYLIK